MKSSELVKVGVTHYHAGRLHEAEVCFRRALGSDPICADAWHLLGMNADAAPMLLRRD